MCGVIHVWISGVDFRFAMSNHVNPCPNHSKKMPMRSPNMNPPNMCYCIKAQSCAIVCKNGNLLSYVKGTHMFDFVCTDEHLLLCVEIPISCVV